MKKVKNLFSNKQAKKAQKAKEVASSEDVLSAKKPSTPEEQKLLELVCFRALDAAEYEEARKFQAEHDIDINKLFGERIGFILGAHPKSVLYFFENGLCQGYMCDYFDGLVSLEGLDTRRFLDQLCKLRSLDNLDKLAGFPIVDFLYVQAQHYESIDACHVLAKHGYSVSEKNLWDMDITACESDKPKVRRCYEIAKEAYDARQRKEAQKALMQPDNLHAMLKARGPFGMGRS